MSRRLWPWLVVVGLAAALVGQTDRARDRIGAGKRLRLVETFSSQMAKLGHAPPQVIAGNFRVLREVERLDPSLVDPLVALGGQYMLTGHYDLAAEVYERALAFEPRAEIYYDLGRALSGAGHEERAREAFAKATALDPSLRKRIPADLRPDRP